MASTMEIVELELCPNCKKEIPQSNYVMHTMHCARNISLCPICKEPIPKGELESHKAKHQKAEKFAGVATSSTTTQLGSRSATTTWKSQPYQGPLPEKLGHSSSNGVRTKIGQTAQAASVTHAKREESTRGLRTQPRVEVPTLEGLRLADGKPGPRRAANKDLSPCRFCELELPRDTMKEHEDYCGTRTDKCNECGEFVMFKYKKLHEESNHGFIKLNDEPGPRPSWDSSTERTSTTSSSSSARRSHYASFDSATSLAGRGPAPQPPAYRRPNPPAELTIPCEFCQTPIPHEDLIQHETGCRPDLARFNPRRRRQEEEFYRYTPSPPPQAAPASPEVELPCEFCADMIPASQLLRHQATCN